MQLRRMPLVILSFIFFSSISLCFAAADTSKNVKSAQDIISLPISADKKINLKVTIPKDFKKIDQEPNNPLVEFIPITDQDPYQWSQIITIAPMIIGKKISAEQYINLITETFQNAAQNVKVIEKKNRSFKNYQDAYVLLQYRNQTREEGLLIYAVSGPEDLASAQYAVLLNPSKIEEGLAQLKNYLSNNMSVDENQNLPK